ncbi:unnamed protein product [Ceutorhynchus assimilis]|uniref:Apoptosis-inducing factor 1, mitochondrial n=1 Tax=Ceutorhynchus assimilis TaxID=467358 RepID=A0A9N9QPQ5_9CUCU|nr:unnamed protein product [Ceutorhynchus assimilis]
MFRARQVFNISRFVLNRSASSVVLYSRNPQLQNTLHKLTLISQHRFSSDDGKKVGSEDGSIESHPSAKPKSHKPPQNLKLKDIKPVEINPCKPHFIPRKKATIQQCLPPKTLSEAECPSEEKPKPKKKGRGLYILGVLLTAASIGAVYYFMGRPDKTRPKKVITRKKVRKEREVIKIPASSSDIPKDVPYLLIGGGTASFTAFRAIKSSDPQAKVLIVSNEPYYPYMRPPLSKEIWFNDDKDIANSLIFKQWNGSERSLFYEPDDFYCDCKSLMSTENGGVAVARGWNITHLDVMEKLAYLEDGSAIKYNKCLIATGAMPRLTPVFEVALADPNIRDHIKLFRNVDDFRDVFEAFDQAKSVAVVGGGFLGSELACAFGRRDKKRNKYIYQIFRETGNMGKILPEYLSLWTSDKVRNEGVQVLPTTEIVGVKAKDEKVELTLSSGKTLVVDFVVCTTGVEPNTELAEKSDLEVDPELGGYLVNTELQARTDLYIAGDCACFYDPRLGRRRIEHHDHAVVSGRLAGENMAGGRNPYWHQSMFWSDLGPDVGYEAIGIVDSMLPTVGVFAKQTDKDTPQHVVEETGEGDRSKTEELPQECEKYLSEEEKKKMKLVKKMLPNSNEGEDYGKGVIFYLRDDVVVGIVLWNVFNRMSIARQVLKDQKKYDDLNEVAKLFNIHGDE